MELDLLKLKNELSKKKLSDGRNQEPHLDTHEVMDTCFYFALCYTEWRCQSSVSVQCACLYIIDEIPG